jgi:hypothetical protein
MTIFGDENEGFGFRYTIVEENAVPGTVILNG